MQAIFSDVRLMKRMRFTHPVFQILYAIALGGLLGHFRPDLALQGQFLGEWFIAAIRILAVPLVFFTVSHGIASVGAARHVGRLGIKTLVVFEAMSTLALVTGLAAAILFQPGAGMPADAMGSGKVAAGLTAAASGIASESLAHTLYRAVAGNAILQTLLLACVCGIVLAAWRDKTAGFARWSNRCTDVLLRLLAYLMLLAPVAAFSAVAYAVAKFGMASLKPLALFLLTIYLVNLLFVAVVLGAVARLTKLRLIAFIGYLKEELVLAFGTASSVTAMPGLIQKAERAGCAKAVAGLTIPSGYSFNLTGSNIYITFALVFLAQANRVELSIGHLAAVLATAMVTSKGASGVAGSALIVLAGTIAAVPGIPANALLLLVGLERLLKCRPLTNIIGNGVACMVVAAWDGKLDYKKARACGLMARD